MALTDALKSLFMDTSQSLKGSARRLCMARTVKKLGPGGQRRAKRALGRNRLTIRKGMHALDSGCMCLDAFSARGRKRAEVHLPHLLHDIQTMVADEKVTWVAGQEVYVPATVGAGCCLGVSGVAAAETAALETGYGEFAQEARALAPTYQPRSVCTDG